MTREEFERKLNELEEQIADLKKTKIQPPMPPKPPHQSWLPQEHENYYTIMSDGTPDMRLWHDSLDGGTSIRRYSLGNVFKTKDEAEFEAEHLKVLAEMREWAGKWDDEFQIGYNKNIGEVSTYASTVPVFKGDMRFERLIDAENCIKAVGEERLKKYYFMIPEEETNNG